MGAHEDYMVMRRAAHHSARTTDAARPVQHGLTALLSKASASELSFIRLVKAGVQDEMIDLAWAVLGEERPGGPAAEEHAAAPPLPPDED